MDWGPKQVCCIKNFIDILKVENELVYVGNIVCTLLVITCSKSLSLFHPPRYLSRYYLLLVLQQVAGSIKPTKGTQQRP